MVNRHARDRKMSAAKGLLIMVAVGVLAILLPIRAFSQIATDGSVGPRGTLIGPNYIIPAELGRTQSPNLFHSFSTFNVLTGESANFTGPSSIHTIFSRVTGGSLSNIDGALKSSIPGVNLFLLNPAGVLFGPNASVNIGGAFRVSTANYVQFDDGYQFKSVLGNDGNFTSAPYTAFGFLGPSAAPITFDRTNLEVSPGQTLAVIGGDISLTGPSAGGVTLQAKGGEVQVVSVASVGVVPLVSSPGTPALSVNSFSTLGTITLTNGAAIAAPSAVTNVTPGGRIVMRGGSLTLDQGSAIFTSTGGDTSASPVALDIAMRGSLVLDNGSVITSTNTGGLGNGGKILLSASNLELRNGSALNNFYASEGNGSDLIVNTGRLLLAGGADIIGKNTGARNAGNGGVIDITATESVIIGPGSTIQTENFQGIGTGSPIQITTPSLTVEGAAGPSGKAGITGITGGFGPASSVTLNVGTLELKGQQALIDTRARNVSVVGVAPPTQGGGPVTVQGQGGAGTVADRVTISGAGSGFLTETEGLGVGGPLTISTRQLIVQSDGRISANTTNAGQAGALTLNLGTLDLTSGGQITTSSTNSTLANAGSAGTITVQGSSGADSAADSLLVSGTNSLISTTTAGSGQGGNIQIKAGQIQIEKLGRVTADTTGKGNAGTITMTGDSLTVASGGRIEASTSGEGKGGSINITTTGDIRVSGMSADGQTRSGIFAKTQTPSTGTGGGGAKPGNAGDIAITATNLLLAGGAQIDSSTTSGGAGGSVSVTTTENIIIAGSSTRLTSNATRGDGKGGNITLVAKNITVRDAASVTAATGGKGDAGNVILTVRDQLLLQSAGTITTSTSGSGTGGTIIIQAGQVLLDGPGTGIAADSLRPFADLTITINILHPNDGDLVVQLDSPTGTRVALLSRVQGSGANFIDTQFNDQTTAQITSGSAPFTGTFKPREPFGQLINELVAGNWTLNVQDKATNNTGTLQNWTLQVGTQTFQSTGAPETIRDNGTLRSTITLANPTVLTVPGVGEASGIGGNVTVNAGSVTVQNGAVLSATSRGSGTGGTLNVATTGALTVTGAGSGLFSDADASGAGGDIGLRASTVALNSGGTISASSSGTGNAGNINIDASGGFTSLGGTVTTTALQGRGGDITMTAGQVTLNGAVISASSQGPGDAGNITINSGVQFLSTNSGVTTEAAQASGGNITVMAQELLRLTNSDISTSVAGGLTTVGGNITIDPNFVILQNSRIVAQAFQGQGGNINITAGTFFADPASLVDASSKLGISGRVNIQAPLSDLSGAITPLPETGIQAAALLRASCAARFQGGERSSLVQRGRDVVPSDPGSGLLNSPFVATGDVLAAFLVDIQKSPQRLTEIGLLRRLPGAAAPMQWMTGIEGGRGMEEAAVCRS